MKRVKSDISYVQVVFFYPQFLYQKPEPLSLKIIFTHCTFLIRSLIRTTLKSSVLLLANIHLFSYHEYRRTTKCNGPLYPPLKITISDPRVIATTPLAHTKYRESTLQEPVVHLPRLAIQHRLHHRQYWRLRPIDYPEDTENWSKNRPFHSCMTSYLGLTRRTTQRGQEDIGDCMQTLDEDCIRDSIKLVKSRVAQYDDSKDDPCDICSKMVQGGLADSCAKYIDSEDGNAGGSSNALRKPILSHPMQL